MAQRKTRETVEQQVARIRAEREAYYAALIAKCEAIKQSSLERDYRVTALMGW